MTATVTRVVEAPARGRAPVVVRHPLFARIYDRLSRAAEETEPANRRRELLAGLRGRVIEVGAGNGLDFRYYPATVDEVVAVEPEACLRERAEETARGAPSWPAPPRRCRSRPPHSTAASRRWSSARSRICRRRSRSSCASSGRAASSASTSRSAPSTPASPERRHSPTGRSGRGSAAAATRAGAPSRRSRPPASRSGRASASRSSRSALRRSRRRT
jgi:hypothetical protein